MRSGMAPLTMRARRRERRLGPGEARLATSAENRRIARERFV